MNTTIYIIQDTTYHVIEGYKPTYEAARAWVAAQDVSDWTFAIVAVDKLPS